jgi:hypothetical protein
MVRALAWLTRGASNGNGNTTLSVPRTASFTGMMIASLPSALKQGRSSGLSIGWLPSRFKTLPSGHSLMSRL